ncbi:ROK family transcriptional regulator [Sphingomonas silueang]|uniref:ROK family transcriptional regulator n=1 Tax=Sphingomonas silueang TaxID=3156617 RepID=UPI0032B52E4B
MQMVRKGTNASGMRRYNERLILSAIRRMNGGSKAELARVTGLSPQAVVRIIDELESEGLLFQAEKRTGGMGQPATVYRINGTRGYTVGVEIGRAAMTLVLLDFDGRQQAVQCDTGGFPTIDAAVQRIDRFLQEQLAHASLLDSRTFLGIGIAMPWFLGEWRDELGISEVQAEEWRRADVADRLRAGLAWPSFFDNDGNAATLAHLLCGAGVDLQNFLLINLGTFVGGGLVLGGQVVQGRHGNAGALASMPVVADGRRDSLIHHASLYDRDRATTPEALDAWRARCAEALAFAITGANSLLDLEAVILDGALDAAELARIAESVALNLTNDAPPDFFTPELRAGSLGAHAAAIGAGLLPLHAQYSPDLGSLFKRD